MNFKLLRQLWMFVLVAAALYLSLPTHMHTDHMAASYLSCVSALKQPRQRRHEQQHWRRWWRNEYFYAVTFRWIGQSGASDQTCSSASTLQSNCVGLSLLRHQSSRLSNSHVTPPDFFVNFNQLYEFICRAQQCWSSYTAALTRN